jgi:hypothetical protein
MDLVIPDAKSKPSFKVLPFLLKTPLERGQKCGKMAPAAMLRELMAEFEVRYFINIQQQVNIP